MKKKQQEKGSFIVRVKRTITVDIECENCTEQEARDNPHNYAVNEEEHYVDDEQIVSVHPVEPEGDDE